MQSSQNQSRNLLSSKKASITNPRLIVLDILLKENRPLTIDQLLKISEGEILFAIVDEQDKGWYQIHTLEGVRGYIFGEPLKLQD